MSNPFKDWKADDAHEHNRRVLQRVNKSMLAIEYAASMALKPIDCKPPSIIANFALRPTTDTQKLNKTERAYLEYLQAQGFVYLGIQNITLKLADDCRLTPDLNYIGKTGQFVFVDVKGFQREDALIKMKIAARLFTWAQFLIVKKDGAGWDVTEVKP